MPGFLKLLSSKVGVCVCVCVCVRVHYNYYTRQLIAGSITVCDMNPICMHVRMYIMCMYACTYVCTYIHMYICMYVCMYIHMYVPMFVCTHICIYIYMYVYIVHRKILAGEKLANLVNCELFAKFSSPVFRYTENVFGICTDCSLFVKFFLTNNFYLYGLSKFSPTKIFPCTVYIFICTYVYKICMHTCMYLHMYVHFL